MAEVGAKPKLPRRMWFKLASNGERIKFYFVDDLGGSFLCYTKVLEEVLHNGRLEGYADFVEDSEKWKSRGN
jgi:hypothetical protein